MREDRPTILCVDDEPTILTSLREQLMRNIGDDIRVEVAESGSEALEVISELKERNVKIPLVIADQIMPGLKGDEFLIQVHKLLPKTLTILLTGQADTAAIGRAVNEAQLYRYISKPWDRGDLVLTVKEAVRSFQQDQTLAEQNHRLHQMNQELEHKISTFNKFVPQEFLNLFEIGEASDHIGLGLCAEREIAILFSDIRSFTPFSERITTLECFRFINSYLSRMVPVIKDHRGFVDKYIGDGIMALFKDADDAVQAALEMIRQLRLYNEGRARAGYHPIAIGIGVHVGKVMLGTIGEENRLQTTVMGDAVNTASRIESLTKNHGCYFLASEDIVQNLTSREGLLIENMGETPVKGKQETVKIYKISDSI